MSVIVRFAPSPTGRLQVGNIRTALFNWLFARHAGGQFLLRLDDTDTERSTEAAAQGILEDLGWLGLSHDLFARQSERTERYDEAALRLKSEGRLYPCYETPEELERKRRLQLARGQPPVYDRAGLKLTDYERAQLEEEGRHPHWRFRLDGHGVVFKDLIRGETKVETASLSDPVLIRADGSFLYTLPSIVDDIDFKISHVIRGEDHVANTGAQIEIFEALGASPPEFAHHSLFVDAAGGKLSKRTESLSVAGLRKDGFEPMAIVSLLARLGTSDPVEPITDMATLIAGFSLDKIGRAPARFEPNELSLLNARVLQILPFADVKERLAALDVGGGEAFWLAVRGNLERLADAKTWWQVVAAPTAPVIEDAEYCGRAAALLPAEPWDEASFSAWVQAIRTETGRKGKPLYEPLRLALTGQGNGPEMKSLLPLIGRERAEARLRGQTA